MKTLIVIDMQNDFISGPLGSPEVVSILPNVKKKIEEFVAGGNNVIFTRDTHDDGYLETNEGKHLPVAHCMVGTHGWEIADGLHTNGMQVIDKTTFGWTGWRIFRGTVGFRDEEDELVLVGVCTDICVVSNALILKAMYPEMRITVDATCCAGVTPETHEAALKTMEMCQIYVERG